jgi:UDP-N-acetylmuramoyl-tripeptide--D-alanyl-D-alanine ligase
MQIPDLYKLFQDHPLVSVDSRKPVKNGIFFALKGENFNGNRFVKDAIHSGCAYAVTDELPDCLDKRIILVDDALQTLQELANYHRKKLGIPIVAITGSNGKTTTKELITRVLEKKFKLTSTPGNLNNHVGVPLTLLGMNENTELGVVEMGANHIGEIFNLCKIAEPDFGIITNIGKAHLEGFGSLEGVKIGKGELYKYLIENNGRIFIHWDNDILRELVNEKDIHLYRYGTSDDCDCIGWITSEAGNLSLQCYSRDLKKKFDVSTNLYGTYNFENALCAISVGLFFKVPVKEILEAIVSYESQNSRSQVIVTERNSIVMDAYNSNPTSLRIAIDEFMKQGFENKVFIIGDMFEMGNYSHKEHFEILELLETLKDVHYLLVGSEFHQLGSEKHLTFDKVESLNEYLEKNPLSGKTILIKGSRGVQLEKCLPYL